MGSPGKRKDQRNKKYTKKEDYQLMKKRATSQNSILERNQEFFLDKQRLGKLIKSKWDFLCCINKV